MDSRKRVRLENGTTMPKVSVIVPVYNVAKYLSKCLDSICHQTYQNLEIICVDDCSTDNSLVLLKNYAERDHRIRVIQRKENGGQAAARQTGIEAAAGKYIGFIDSDDWVDEDYYEKMVDKAEKHKTDIVINGNILIPKGQKVYPLDFPGHKLLQEKVYDMPSEWIDKFFCVVWNKLFKADFLKVRKYTIPNRNAHEDVFFHYVAFAFAKDVFFFNGSAYYYFLREQSISNQKHDWGVEHIKVYSQIYDFYKENNLLNRKIKFYATMPFFVIKSEEMFNEYKKYFQKVLTYFNENTDVFYETDIFLANIFSKCADYDTYRATYPESLAACFLRRKR